MMRSRVRIASTIGIGLFVAVAATAASQREPDVAGSVSRHSGRRDGAHRRRRAGAS